MAAKREGGAEDWVSRGNCPTGQISFRDLHFNTGIAGNISPAKSAIGELEDPSVNHIRTLVLLAVGLIPRLDAQCETAQILGPTGDPGARMGGSIALAGDTLVVGLPSSDAYGVASGEVRVYRKMGTGWVLGQSLGALASVTTGDRFGTSVSVEFPYIAVGAEGVDWSLPDVGAVYVFKDNGSGTYTLQKKLLADSFMSTAGQAFGCSVSVSAGWLIVGAKYADWGGTDSGGAFVYKASATNWFLEQTLDSGFSSTGDLCGASVATKNGIFAVGSPMRNVGGDDTGAVRIYFLDENFLSDPYQVTGPFPAQPGAHFGSSVAVSDLSVAVGAPHRDTGAQDSGAVHLFRISAGTDWGWDVYKGWWLEQTISPAAPQAFEEFGSAVALDGSTLVVGSRLHDSLPAMNTGSIDVYRRAGSVWEPRAHLNPSQSAQEDGAGWSVAVSGAVLVAGAPGDDVSGAIDAGSVTAWSMTECPGFYASVTTTTNSLPQTTQFSLNAGSGYAFRPYAILGSLTGTSPGFNLHGAHVPLSFDAYTQVTASSAAFPGFWGQLNSLGKASVNLPMPAYLPPVVIGITLRHAFVAQGAPGTPWYASNAEPLAFIKVWETGPWPNAGPNWSGDEESYAAGATVDFDGNDSGSTNGWIEQWYWDFGDKKFGTGAQVSHKYDKGGDYVVTLTVIDNVGVGGQDTRLVHINKMPLGIINVLTTNPIQGQDVWFSSADSFDPDGTVENYEWTFDGNVVVTSNTDISWKFLSPGVHDVTLTAIDDDGLAGSNIAEALVSVAGCPTPNPPSGLVGTPTSTTSASLTWLDHATNETAYRVSKKDPGSTNWVDIGGDLPPNTKSFVVNGLAAGQTYQFRVRCKNGCGDSPSSNPVSVTTFCPSAAPAPFNCEADRMTTTPQPDPILVTWSYSGPPVSGFRIARLNPGLNENNPDHWHNIGGNLPSTQFSYIDTANLENGKTYKYKVRNFIDAGEPCGTIYSAYSNINAANP